MSDRLVIHFQESALNNLMRILPSVHPFIPIRWIRSCDIRYDVYDPINDVNLVTISILLTNTVILHLIS